MIDKRPGPARRNKAARLTEADTLVRAADRDASALEVTLEAAAYIPGVGGLSRPLIDRIREQRLADVTHAVQRIIDALNAVEDAVLERLESDDRFAAFISRLCAEAVRPQRRDKIEYYARLLERSAPSSGPDADDRIRLLDVLDALGLHHLRLFAAFATTESAPPDIQRLGDVWETVRYATGGLDRETAQRDVAVLQAQQLLESGGWASTTNLRFALTEFGLEFEWFVSGDGRRRQDRWQFQVLADAEVMPALARVFAADERPSIVRERGGFYLVGLPLKSDEAHEIRREADDFIRRVQSLGRMSGEVAGKLRIGRITENVGGETVVHEAPTLEQEPSEHRASPAPAYLTRLAIDVVQDDPVVARVMKLLEEGSWDALVECMNTMEREHDGSLASEVGSLSDAEVDRFNAQARAGGLDRPSVAEPGAMTLDQAADVVRRAFIGWLSLRVGR